MQSPCVMVCKIDDGVCRGCGRTLEEIREWAAMSDEQRAEITRRVLMADTDRDEWMKPCRCTFAQKVVGDGCNICNPERARELSEEDDDGE